ncbi:MAG TPA: DUF4191 domain-containing protein [Frankiaceae bacterium]|jgi:hypothetical protein|nr:DUF4191 domain-containing protein [Frankiaceae bacterium]
MARKGANPAGETGGSGAKRGSRAAAANGGEEKQGRLKQMRLVFKLTRERDPKLVLWTAVAFLVPLAIGVALGFVLKPLWLWIPAGVIFGVLLALNVFGRRAQRSAFTEMEGQPGAGISVVQRMRGDWRVTTPVAVNRNQDLVSRVVSRAGIIVIAEGRGRGARDLLAAEMRRVRKVAGDAPVIDIIVGNGEGEIPLAKLQNTLMRKRRVLRRGEMDELYRRLAAMGAMNLPIPKGPMPTRVPRGGKIR